MTTETPATAPAASENNAAETSSATTQSAPDGNATSQPNSNPAAAPADGQPQNGGEQTGENTGKPEEGKKDGDDGKPQGAPEKYEAWSLPEGVTPNPDRAAKFETLARKYNLSQEAAQEFVNLGLEPLTEQFEALAQTHAKWAEDSKTDKEFGGEQFTENLSVAKKALDTFGTPELRQLLVDSGYGNNPEIIRTFYRVGKALSDDGLIRGVPGNAQASKSAADVLYGNSNS